MMPRKESSATVKTSVIEVLGLILLFMERWLFAVKASLQGLAQPHLRLQYLLICSGSDFF